MNPQPKKFKVDKEFKKYVKIYSKRIKAGIRYLNRVKPGWYNHINLETLDLHDSYNCILGQAFQDYWNKVREEDAFEWDKSKITQSKAQSLGFLLDSKFGDDYENGHPYGYDLLTKVWYSHILLLLAK